MPESRADGEGHGLFRPIWGSFYAKPSLALVGAQQVHCQVGPAGGRVGKFSVNFRDNEDMTRYLSTSLLVLAFLPIAAQSTQNVAQESFTLSVLTTGLEYPWEITWGPDGYLWVTERTAKRVTPRQSGGWDQERRCHDHRGLPKRRS